MTPLDDNIETRIVKNINIKRKSYHINRRQSNYKSINQSLCTDNNAKMKIETQYSIEEFNKNKKNQTKILIKKNATKKLFCKTKKNFKNVSSYNIHFLSNVKSKLIFLILIFFITLQNQIFCVNCTEQLLETLTPLNVIDSTENFTLNSYNNQTLNELSNSTLGEEVCLHLFL